MRAQAEKRPGPVIRGKYELLEEAGRGGMAVVWRAIQRGDLGFSRTVAVKQMHDHLAERQLYIDMFAEEARVGAELLSPNIAQVYDFVAEDGAYFLVMEWVEGIDLGSLIHHHNKQGTQMRWELVAAIGIGVLRALAAAHEREARAAEAPIVHRDVSPHNILITPRGMVKLVDWGLSLAFDRERETTDPGVVKGKMSYLSPEIVAGNRPTPPADQFAVGSVLWESLVGRKLFDGPNDLEVYKKVREAQVQPLRPLRRDIPKDLVSIIHRALARHERDRFDTVREMGRELGLVLRRGRAPKDLHHLLGRSVLDARDALELGRRTGERGTATPVADLPEEETPAVGSAAPGPDELVENEPGGGRPRGILHRLPFFRKRK